MTLKCLSYVPYKWTLRWILGDRISEWVGCIHYLQHLIESRECPHLFQVQMLSAGRKKANADLAQHTRKRQIKVGSSLAETGFEFK